MRTNRYSHLLFSIIVFLSAAFTLGAKNKNLIACDTAYAGADQQICGDSTLLEANTPLNGAGAWTLVSGSGVFSNSASDSTSVTGLSTGANVFAWTITGGGCPTVSDTVVILVDSVPTSANAGPDQQVCADSAVLSANTPTVGTGSWVITGGSGTVTNPNSPSTTVTNLGAGNNTFEWKISSGTCASQDVVTITRVLPPVAAAAGPDTTFCDTTFFLAGNTPPFGSGTWTVISGSATVDFPLNSGSSVSGMTHGSTSTFVWTLSNSVCPSSSDTVTINIDLLPTTSNAGNDQTVCSNFTAIAGNTPSTGTGMWSVAGGSVSIANPSSPGTTITAIGEGVNALVWSISNGVCAASTDTIFITNQENSVPDAGADQNICALSTTLSADTPTVGNGTWTLVSGGGSILFPNSPSTLVSNLNTGANIFIWTVANGICPSKTDTIVITVNPPSTTANAGADFTVCGNSAVLSGSSPVNGTGSWSLVSGGGIFSNPNSGSTGVSGMNTGANAYAWTIVSGNCPASSDTVVVTSVNAPSAAQAGSDTTICADSIQLSATAPASGSGTWTVVTTGPSVSAAGSAVTLASGLVTGQNVFAWTVSSGSCPSTTDTVVITVDAMPDAANAGSDINTDQALISLSANAPAVGTGVWANLSSEGNIVNPLLANSAFTVTESGEFQLVWTTSNGVCPSSSDTLNIKTEFTPIPEIITPNGDKQNDVFLIKSLLFSNNIKLTIINRWGNVVYVNDDYQHDFDGKNKAGEELEEDSYFYRVEANGIEKFEGYLIIKRK